MSDQNRLVIVGAGGFGRELHAWVVGSPCFRSKFAIDEVIFVDDNLNKQDLPAPVIESVGRYLPASSDFVLCALGDPAARRSVTEDLLARGARFATFVHDSAILGMNVRLGAGVVVCPHTILTADVVVGEHAQINANCVIGHDVVIGDFVTLSPSCNLTGGVHVQAGAFLGTAVTVIPGKTIGSNATVGAGSVVLRSVKPGTVAFGNPCRQVGENDS